jgi:ribosomal protein L16 Arg81 hydroxylase
MRRSSRQAGGSYLEDVMDISWDALLSPIGEAEFERDYFSRRPLHLKTRNPPNCGLESIAGWRSMLSGQRTRLQGRRVVIDIDIESSKNNLLSRDIEVLLDRGGPLIVNGIEKINPVVKEIAEAVAAGLGGAAVVNGYISPYREDALDLHADDHEVVVLQLRGVKSWTIGSQIAKGLAHSNLFAIDNASISDHARRTDSFSSLELHPGDLLYLPRGLAHRATARDDISMHLSIGVFRPTGLDFTEFVLKRLIAEISSRDYFPNLRTDENETANRAYMDFMAERLDTLARNEELRRAFLDRCRKNAGLG